MNHKRFLPLILTLLLLLCSAIYASAATFSPALEVISHSTSLTVNGIKGNDIKFSKSLLKSRLSCNIIGNISISKLPDSDSGTLLMNGQPVKVGDVFSARAIDKLIFSPKKNGNSQTSFELRVESSGICYSVECNIIMLEHLNFSPVISSSGDVTQVSTFSQISIFSKLCATDPENDDITFSVISYPQKGELKIINHHTGEYRYTPFENACGEDSFSVVAVDKYGNRSTPESISITIDQPKSGTLYADMKYHPDGYAATLLSEMGIFSGERLGGASYFLPDKEVSAAEFITFVLNAAQIPPAYNENHSCIVKNSENIDERTLGYLCRAEILGYIDAEEFDPCDTITFEEGADILAKVFCMSEYGAVAVFNPQYSYAINSLTSKYQNITIPDSPNNFILTRASCAKLLSAILGS